jgi:hypothetical protein
LVARRRKKLKRIELSGSIRPSFSSASLRRAHAFRSMIAQEVTGGQIALQSLVNRGMQARGLGSLRDRNAAGLSIPSPIFV